LSEAVISEGDDVLLFLDRKRNYLVKVKSGENFHTHKGYIQLDYALGKRYGEYVFSSLGFKFILFKPTTCDYMKKSIRSTQIIYSKDMALIVVYAGIGPGSRVVEAGTGSGALTNALAHFVKPGGKIYSYEIRREFLDIATKNLTRAGITEYVELKNTDITLGISEKQIDAVVLDLATPWLVVEEAYSALRGSGQIVSFSPTIDQVVKMVGALTARGFMDIETVECFVRRIKVKEGSTRPEGLMRGHTGYITHGRKVFNE
jgi:tRNA (adenine57-N1/adenine58-N1)-methyltransferase